MGSDLYLEGVTSAVNLSRLKELARMSVALPLTVTMPSIELIWSGTGIDKDQSGYVLPRTVVLSPQDT